MIFSYFHYHMLSLISRKMQKLSWKEGQNSMFRLLESKQLYSKSPEAWRNTLSLLLVWRTLLKLVTTIRLKNLGQYTSYTWWQKVAINFPDSWSLFIIAGTCRQIRKKYMEKGMNGIERLFCPTKRKCSHDL